MLICASEAAAVAVSMQIYRPDGICSLPPLSTRLCLLQGNVYRTLLDIANGIHYLHSVGIVHGEDDCSGLPDGDCLLQCV